MPIWSSLQNTAPFDRLARLAVQLVDAPMCIVSLVHDGVLRPFSWTGIPEPCAASGGEPQPYLLCDHVYGTRKVDSIPDVRDHPRLTPGSAGDVLGVAAYLGIPLRTKNERVVGVIAVMDRCPRPWTASQIELLQDLAESAVTEVELLARTVSLERAQAELRQTEQRFRQLAENIQEGFWMAEPDSERVLYVNPALEHLYGRDMSAIYRDPVEWIQYIHPGDLARVHEELDTKPLHQFDAEFRVVRPDGEIRWAHGRGFPVYDERGTIYRVVGVTADITERKRSERELLERETRLSEILESITDRFLALDSDWRFTYLNRRAATAVEQRLGCPASDILGRSLWDVVPSLLNTSVERELRRVVAERTPAHFEEHVAPLDTWYEIHAYPSPGNGLSIYYREITKRKRAEEALRTAKEEAEAASRAKSELFSRSSHELRTPLNAILGFAQLLAVDLTTPEDRESVDEILRAGRHLLKLVDEVLDIANADTGQLAIPVKPVQVESALIEVLGHMRFLAEQRGVELPRRAPVGCSVHVLADRERLRQVLLHLISNAIQYNWRGGRVVLACEEVAGDRVRILVHDTGPGIGAERLTRLFEPFDRLDAEKSIATRAEGAGLGLAVAKALAQAMGGQIGVRSAPGEGSTFWIELPRAGHSGRPTGEIESGAGVLV